MRFYAVSPKAIQHTHHALQRLQGQRRGSSQSSRALRVATLYGHLQCHADAKGRVHVRLRQLAEAMLLHRNLLRADLRDLQAMGWLSASGTPEGTRVQLHSPVLQPASMAPAKPLAAASPTTEAPTDLMALFCATYNAHKPHGWPSYSSRGKGLEPRLRRAIQYAGGAEAFWAVMAQALAAMPQFWRCHYPVGRCGADCAAALFSADRSHTSLGPEFWHVFTWGAAVVAGSGPGASGVQAENEFNLARRLFVWGDHAWIGQGMEAVKLPMEEKRRLAELLEAAGLGEAGQAARQFQPAFDAP